MCGIAGILKKNNNDVVDIIQLKKMSEIIAYRGPDASGIYINQQKKIGLAHRRLSIVDLSSNANQPMRDEAGNWIVFNGEIYNYKEIISKLNLSNLKTKSDTEIILHTYQKYGDKCVDHLEGMFAFAIWDEQKQTLFCARDHFGIKPFYYFETNSTFYFASEAKALLPIINNVEVDNKALKDYLVFQLYLSSKTLFKGIKELPPASSMQVNDNKLILKKYWNLTFNIDFDHTEKYFVEKTQDLLEKSIKRHLIGDVKIGGYVSGGLDSSSIASIANEQTDSNDFIGFTGKFSKYGDKFDESYYAKLVGDKNSFQILTHEITSSDFINNIQKVIYHLDSPVAGPGSFSQFMISKFVSKFRKVVLGGQGGDEIFGGYIRYLIAYFEQCIKASVYGTSENGKYVVNYSSITPSLPQLKQYVPMLKSFWSEGLFDDMYERYFRLINRAPNLGNEINWDYMEGYSAKNEYKKIFFGDKIDRSSYFDLMTNYDFKTLLPALLQVEDRMSMAHGVESRVPLLDKSLIEFSATIPADIKFKDGNPKHIFKLALEKYLPKEIIERKDKMGFPTPINQWFQNEIYDFVCDTFSSIKARNRDYVKSEMLIDQIKQEGIFNRKIWGLLSLELWHQEFID